jgi:hypothetical protein
MPSDFFLPFTSLIKILKLIGLWRVKTTKKVNCFYCILLHMLFVEVFIALQFGLLLSLDDFQEFSSFLVTLPFGVSILIKSKKYFFNTSSIEEIFERIEEILESFEVPEKFRKRLVNIDRTFKFLYKSGLIACLLVLLVPLSTHELPYRMWFPFTHDDNLELFWCGVIYQLLVSVYFTVIDTVLYTFPLVSMIYIYGLQELLADQVVTLVRKKTLNPDGSINEQPQINCQEEFIKIIKIDQKIREVTKRIENFFSLGLLTGGLQSTLVICSTAFLMTEVRIFVSILNYSSKSANKLVIIHVHRYLSLKSRSTFSVFCLFSHQLSSKCFCLATTDRKSLRFLKS